jgi:hypothetical protein
MFGVLYIPYSQFNKELPVILWLKVRKRVHLPIQRSCDIRYSRSYGHCCVICLCIGTLRMRVGACEHVTRRTDAA